MSEWSDIVNSAFILSASVFLFRNIMKLHKDKKVRGVASSSVLFFALWGYWNMWFYPYNGHMFSFFAGILIAITNTIWGIQMVYYILKEKKKGDLH